MTSEREKLLNIQRLSDGRWPFGIPYGYREGTGVIVNVRHKDGDKTRLRRQVIRTIEIDNEAAPIIQRLFQLYAENVYSLLEIKTLINKEFKKRLHTSMMYRILANPFYVGKMEYDGVVYYHHYGNILSVDLFNEVQYLRKESTSHRSGKPTKHAFPFKRILKCAFCEGNITAEQQKTYIYYKCNGSYGRHKFKYVRYERIFEYIMHQLTSFCLPDSFIEKFSDEVQGDIRNFRENMANWFLNGSKGKRSAISNLIFDVISIDSMDENLRFSCKFNEIWNLDTIPEFFIDKFYVVYWLCTDKISPTVAVENSRIKLSLRDKILRMCIKPQSLDELIEAYGVSLEEIQDALFDIQLEGRIVQDISGKWATVK